jgi:hypothetical protein
MSSKLIKPLLVGYKKNEALALQKGGKNSTKAPLPPLGEVNK